MPCSAVSSWLSRLPPTPRRLLLGPHVSPCHLMSHQVLLMSPVFLQCTSQFAVRITTNSQEANDRSPLILQKLLHVPKCLLLALHMPCVAMSCVCLPHIPHVLKCPPYSPCPKTSFRVFPHPLHATYPQHALFPHVPNIPHSLIASPHPQFPPYLQHSLCPTLSPVSHASRIPWSLSTGMRQSA